MRLRFGLEDERDALAGEMLAELLVARRPLPAFPADALPNLERTLGLTAGLAYDCDPLIKALLEAHDAIPYRLWIAAEVAIEGREESVTVRDHLALELAAQLPA